MLYPIAVSARSVVLPFF